MDKLVLVVTAVSIVALAVVLCATMKPHSRLAVAAALMFPQFYLPGLIVTVSDAWLLIVALVTIFDRNIRLRRTPFVLPILSFASLYILAQLWSAPAFTNAFFLLTVRLFLYAMLIRYAITAAVEAPKILSIAARCVTPWILVQAGLVIVFRIDHALALDFLRSPVANVLVGPSATGLFSGFENNVLDPLKSGGLFVNANVASMQAGVAVFVMLAAGRVSGSKWYKVWALASWISVFFTGSKTGIGLAIILPVLAFILTRASAKHALYFGLPVVLLAAPIAYVVPRWVDSVFPVYSNSSAESYDTRTVLWDGAWNLFQHSPFLGLGFGGWSNQVFAATGLTGYPPHNLIIAAWADAGLGAAITVVWLIIVTGLVFLAWTFRSNDPGNRRVIAYGFTAMLWIFVHGMGDNTTVYGESKTMILAVLAIGFAYLAQSRSLEEYPRSFGNDPIKVPRSKHQIPDQLARNQIATGVVRSN